MRSGGWSVQQALAADAAAVMRQAVSAARRRGHAQVTPLHVAAAALAHGAGGGLLRGACVRSRCPPGSFSSHPALQCKALELCLNVALSRLATAAGGVFGSFQQQTQPRAPPALSNALAAALKRAQANQRRGGGGGSAAVEAAAAAKVELEQLVISILDDPSVSRVMREAGFSSAEVKANVEKAAAVVSPEQPPSSTNTGGSGSLNPPNTKGAKTDVATRVLDCMAASAGRRRCVMVVGESAAAAERVVKSVMDKVSKGEELELRHERLRNLQFVPLSFASFQRMTREEVEAGAGELRELVRRGDAAGKGVVLVLEDLGCAAEAWAASSARRSDHHRAPGNRYCPVEHAVMELSRVMRDGGGDDHDRFWVLAFGDHASYAVCKAGQPSLESVLEMHPVVVPQGGGLVALSLGGGDVSELTFCGADTVAAAPASVPSWLHRCHGPVVSGPELTLSFSSPASCASSISGFTQYNPNMIPNPWHDPFEQRQHLWPLNHRHDGPVTESHHHDQQWPASPTPGSYSSSASKSISSGGATEAATAARRLRRPRFTELTAENLKLLCGAVEARVPRHGAVAPGVASAVLRRRSGVASTRRRRVAPPPSSAAAAAATWLLFQGPDGDGKAAVARELARLVFGSYDAFTVIAATGFTNLPSRSGSRSSGAGEGELRRRGIKRPRSSSPEAKQEPAGYMQLFHDAIRENPHRVVLIDGIDDDDSEAGFIKSAIATGTVRSSNGVDVASLEDVIVVLSCEVFESWSRALPPLDGGG
ncbi:hypothetical protein EJB05_02359, partial [Eragrostis curvula]